MSEVVRRLTEDVANIQKLGDNPRTDNGMDAAELKAWFDKAPEAIKAFLNESMIPDLEKKFKSQDEWADGVDEAIKNFVKGEGFLPSDGSVQMTGDLNMGNHRVVGVANPTEASHAANKQYVDSVKDTANSALAKANAAQPALNFVPVQQGFTATGGNKISLAWKEANNGRYGIAVMVDNSAIGTIIVDNAAYGGTLPIGNGGTDATTRGNALKNLNADPGNPEHMDLSFADLQSTGLVAESATTQYVLERMPANSSVKFTHLYTHAVRLTDVPFNYAHITLTKGLNNDFIYADALDIAVGVRYEYRNHRTSNTYMNGWKRILTNQLTTDDYGTAFPSNAKTGQIFFLKG